MTTMQGTTLDIAPVEHAERIRGAERPRRAGEARTEPDCRTAARRERRFSFVRTLMTRQVGA
jgi:hypothetical protein